MLKSQLHSFVFSKYVIASAFVGVGLLSAVLIVQDFNNKKVIQSQKNLINTLNQKVDVLERDIMTNEIENSLLINDYQLIDSMLYESKIANVLILDNNIVESHSNKLAKSEKKNIELKNKIAKLLTEVQYLQKEVSKFNQVQNVVNHSVVKPKTEKQIDNKINIKTIKYKSFATFNGFRGVKNTKKARKAKEINLCIDLSEFENESLFKNQDLYLRIANPNGKILSSLNENNDTFIFDGHNIAYSLKVKYDINDSKSMFCVVYTPDIALIPGVYWIDVFLDNEKVGETSFELY